MTTEVYRQTKLGDALVSALEDLLDSSKMTPELAIKVLSEVSVALTVLCSRLGCHPTDVFSVYAV